MKHLMKTFSMLLLSSALCSADVQANTVTGITVEKNNQGSIKNVNVSAYDATTNELVTNSITDNDGKFRLDLPTTGKYRIVAEKKSFFFREAVLEVKDKVIPVKIVMERKPGYTFDVSLSSAAPARGNVAVKSIIGARIEVYNNTTKKQELSLVDHPIASFKFNFEEGNHYTIMVRKKGYLTKRIEAYINVNGCILCFDGMGMVRPDVVDVMTNENQLGSFLGNLELEPVEINKTFKIENLYYDYNKYNIRKDASEVLDDVVQVLKDNPAIKLELGAHTDARGSDGYNLSLSDNRAKSAVEYLVKHGVHPDNLSSKGYGESQLVNECGNGIKCPDDVHEQNRRTELKVVDIADEDPLDKKTLKQIIEGEGYRAPTPFYQNPFENEK